MAIRKWLKMVLLKLLYNKHESITFHNIGCCQDGIYVEFFVDGFYEVQLWKEYQERRNARPAVVQAKWNCGKLQQVADSVQEGETKLLDANGILNIIRLDARYARNRASAQLEQGPSGWL